MSCSGRARPAEGARKARATIVSTRGGIRLRHGEPAACQAGRHTDPMMLCHGGRCDGAGGEPTARRAGCHTDPVMPCSGRARATRRDAIDWTWRIQTCARRADKPPGRASRRFGDVLPRPARSRPRRDVVADGRAVDTTSRRKGEMVVQTFAIVLLRRHP